MKILILTHFFFPETGGTPNRILPIARSLTAAGHDVHVVTNAPNHPEGRIREGYRGRLFHRRAVEGIPVTYCWVYASPRKGFLHRILNYLSFAVLGVAGAVRVRGRFDIVFATSPPLPVGLAGWAVKHLKGARYVFDVRDVWPEVAVALGELTHPRAVRVAEWMERFIYRSADAVTTVTHAFVRDIRATAGGSKRVELVRNGTVPEVFRRDEQRAEIRAALGAKDRFVLLYAGNIGVAQELDHVLEAASLLEREGAGCLFLLVGSGARLDELRGRAAERGLETVRFLPRVPLREAAGYFAAADALLVPLAPHEVFRKYIPSKLYDSMAAGRPVLLSVDGEARALLEQHEAGLYYPPGDAAGLARAVRTLQADPDEARSMGARGRSAAETLYARHLHAARLLALFEELAGTPSANNGRTHGGTPPLSSRHAG